MNNINAQTLFDYHYQQIEPIVQPTPPPIGSTDRHVADAWLRQMNDPSTVDEWLRQHIERGKHGQFTIAYEVTQTMADRLMAINTHNRKLDPAKIRSFVKIITEDRFLLHGQGIAVNRDGILSNGQHRLAAFQNTKRPSLPVSVTFGEDPDAFRIIDRQKPRSPAVILGLDNEKYGTLVAAALRLLTNIKRNTPRSNYPLDNDEFKPLLVEQFAELRDSAPQASRANSHLKCSSAGLGAAHYLILTESRRSNKLDEFWDRFVTGVDLRSRTDPILRLRNRINNLTGSRKGGGIPAHEVAASVILCWNAWISNKALKQTWGENEEFPMPL